MTLLSSLRSRIFLTSALLAVLSIGAAIYLVSVRVTRELEASLQREQVPFSCLRTCQAWGPDDDIVAPERCSADRPCFERDRIGADVT